MILQLILLIVGPVSITSAAECVNVVEENCPADKIDFRLFTSQNEPYKPLLLNEVATDDSNVSNSIRDANFHDQAEIKFILHGYTGGADNPLMKKFISEYLQSKTPVNVIMVNYNKVAKDGCYLQLFKNTANLGKCSAQMVRKIIELKPGIKLEQFHIIGFSIGAHIAAEISNHLEGKKPRRITGLDPAFMLFWPMYAWSKSTLRKQHAEFVDIIHSTTFWYGIPYSGGHYDFYANKGMVQPGCDKAKDRWKCYHKMSVEYFIKTINKKETYIATQIPCAALQWLFGLCWSTGTARREVGEHAVKPNPLNPNEEGPYHFVVREFSYDDTEKVN